MAIRIVDNKRSTVTILATGTETVIIAGNNSVSNIALAGVTDDIVGASIKQVWFGSISGGSGFWEITRGANVVLMVDSTAWFDFAGNGRGLSLDSAANVTMTRTGANGTMMMELKKIYAVPTDSDY
jgi:hypothetical protein